LKGGGTQMGGGLPGHLFGAVPCAWCRRPGRRLARRRGRRRRVAYGRLFVAGLFGRYWARHHGQGVETSEGGLDAWGERRVKAGPGGRHLQGRFRTVVDRRIGTRMSLMDRRPVLCKCSCSECCIRAFSY
jgi:hypothetical protein